MAQITFPKETDTGCKCFQKQLEGNSCTLTFKYVNTNSIQDDAFDFYLLNNDDTWIWVGNIDGKCGSYSGSGEDNCNCASEDTRTFEYTIDNSFISTDCAGSPMIVFKNTQSADNGCGTFGTFDIIGPNGIGFGGLLGDEGSIDVSVACTIKE
jgi:hypothetical protein